MAKHPDADWRQHVLNSLPRMEGPAEPAITGFTPGPANPQPLSFDGFPGGPNFDVIELLPPAAAAKLLLLRQRRLDARALSIPFSDIQEASMARVSAEQALKRLTDSPQDGGFGLKPDDRQVVAAQRTRDKATADFERVKQRSEVRTAQWQTVAQATTACESFPRDGRPHGTVLEQFDGPAPQLLKNETVLDAIDRLRRRGRELRAALHTIQSSCYPSSYCKRRAREQVEILAQRGAVSVSGLVEHDGDLQFPEMQITSTVYNVVVGAVAYHQGIDVAGLIAFLHKSELIAALDREIDAESDDGAAMTHEARQKAEAEVQGDLLSVERDESSLVWRAQSEGLPVEHRADCSPLAILGCQLIASPRASNAPTSPEHGYNIVPAGLRR